MGKSILECHYEVTTVFFTVSLNGAFVLPNPDGSPGNLSPLSTGPDLHEHRDVCTGHLFILVGG